MNTSIDKNFLTKDMSDLMCIYKPEEHQHTQKNIEQYLKNTLDEISRDLLFAPQKKLILTLVWETCDAVYWKDSFQQFLTKLKQVHPTLEIIIIFESWFEPFQLNFISVNEVYYIDFWVYKVYEFLMVQRISEPVLFWDSTNQNILFMTGKTYKIHRTRLLYKLLNSEIKNYLSWSYQTSQQHLHESLVFLNDLSVNQQNEFLSLAQRKLDLQQGVKFDSDIFKNSVLQIISETDFDRPLSYPFITEKTWISIANHRPFIIASELGHLAKLNSYGIHTFNQYLAIPNYDNPSLENFLTYATDLGNTRRFYCNQELDNWRSFYQNFKDESWIDVNSINDINQLPDHVQHELQLAYQPGYYSVGEIRLDAIVENAVFFKKNVSKFSTEINQDINHNFQIFLKLAKNAQDKLKNLHIKHCLVCKNLYDVFDPFILA